MRMQQWKEWLHSEQPDEGLAALYGADNTRREKRRIRSLLYLHCAAFPEAGDIRVFSAPGRSEIAGNHTDHQHGRVLAASTSLDIVAAVSPVAENGITIKSAGFAPFRVDLSCLTPVPEEKGCSASLVRGVASALLKRGYRVGGFCATLQSNVPRGSGLSSSAAFSVLVGAILSGLYNEGRVQPSELAAAGQIAENEFFGKPSGLLDQLASATGGFAALDFADPARPLVTRIPLDVGALGYGLVIVNPGGSHAGLTDEYAAIPAEMHTVAAYFGKQYLREVEQGAFYDALPKLRACCTDRAILRAMHFFDEDARVADMISALQAGDMRRFAFHMRASGESSFMLLQNVCPTAAKERSLALALALTARILDESCAWRVHGGGFAGTILALMPDARQADYCAEMARVFGKDCCYPLRIRPCGGVELGL